MKGGGLRACRSCPLRTDLTVRSLSPPLDSLAYGKVKEELKYELTGDSKAVDPSVPLKARLSRYQVGFESWNGLAYHNTVHAQARGSSV